MLQLGIELGLGSDKRVTVSNSHSEDVLKSDGRV